MGNRRQNKGLIPLSIAAWDFAPKRLQQRWHNAQAQASSLANKPPFDSLLPDASEYRWARAVEFAGKILHNAIAGHEERSVPFEEMRGHLLRRLSLGTLEGWGVQISPQLGSQRDLIPSFVFENRPKVDWDKNAIENMGRKYGAVEVRRVPRTTVGLNAVDGTRAAEASRELAIPGRPKVGRPTNQDAIDNAIAVIMAENPAFCSMKRKVAASEVRTHLKLHQADKFADGRGLADTTIEKRISALCRARLKT